MIGRSPPQDDGGPRPRGFGLHAFSAAPDMLESEALGWLASLLLQAKDQDRLPTRAELSPRRIGAAGLPNMLMMEVEGEPPRFLLRLVGTRLVRLAGRDNTGRYFDELAAEHRDAHPFYQRVLARVAIQARPLVVTANLFYHGRDWLGFRALVAPLSSDGDRVDRIVGAIEFDPAKLPF